MILRDSSQRILTCDICNEDYGLTRSQAANPETMMLTVEQVTADHRECERNKTDPARGARERSFRKRLERAERKPKR